ncbi:ribosome biogenesis GTPase Der [bacterium]|nr:ribosome biogenesis GTPase Der [bacterium]
MKNKVIAIVGRPNVGKSTLINRILGERKSIVDDMAGVTRDRIYFDAEWQDKPFIMIDTGGIITDDTESEFVQNIFTQAKIAIEEADLILFVVDAKSGLSPYDKDIANILRREKKKVILVANKVDSIDEITNISDFYELSLGEPQAVSALHGSGGVGDLLDLITEDIEKKSNYDDSSKIKVAIVGKPNAGKSSILNSILNENRAIVSDVSGTTRDSINSEITYKDQEFILIDTAGIRKKSKVSYGIEAFAVDRALRSIREADVAVIVIDAVENISDQDKKIMQTVEEAGVGVIVAFNKWDLIQNVQTHKYEKEVEQEIPFLSYAKKLFISAKTGKRLTSILDEAMVVAAERNKRVSTGILNKVINESIELNPPASVKGKRLRIYYSTQVKAKPPTFALFVNNVDLIRDSYKKYLAKKLRENFGFFGTPIRIGFREKGEK